MQVWATAVAPWSARASVEVADGAGSGDGAKEVASVGTVVSIGDDFMLGTLPGCIVCVSVGGGGGFVHGGMGRDVVGAIGSSVIVHSVKGFGAGDSINVGNGLGIGEGCALGAGLGLSNSTS